MPTTNPIAAASTVPAPTSQPKTTLGKDDFLKLLAAELRQQDPNNTTDSKEMMQQLTQFGILEQITNLAEAQDRTATAAATAELIAAIGHTVQYTTANGPVSGTVDSVSLNADGSALLTIGGVSGISPSDVLSIS